MYKDKLGALIAVDCTYIAIRSNTAASRLSRRSWKQ